MFSTLESTYIRFGRGGVWGNGLHSTSHGSLGHGLAKVAVDGTATLWSSGYATPEGFDWDPGFGYGGDLFATDTQTGEVWRVKPDGSRTLFGTLPGAAAVGFCNGSMYVVSRLGRRYKVVNVVGVDPDISEARLQLGAAIPNPWTDRTTLRFTLARESRTSLEIYDLLGRRLKRWSWTKLPAGLHQVTWDGRSDDGRPTAPSVLFYRLETGVQVLKQKMIRLQ